MEFINKIKGFFYKLSLNSKVKNSKSYHRDMVNIQDANNLGILYNASNPKDVMVVTQFAEKLKNQNKQIYILGYQNTPGKEDLGPKFFDSKEVNLFGVPSSPKIDNFHSLKLDILICAFKEECLPLEYIAATSNATFRVGVFSKYKTNFYELMINIDSKENLHFLLQQILHFTKVINRDEN